MSELLTEVDSVRNSATFSLHSIKEPNEESQEEFSEELKHVCVKKNLDQSASIPCNLAYFTHVC